MSIRYRLNKYNFQALAEKLVQLFPCQTSPDIFFTPSQNNRDPAGKLYNAYITIRARMARAGLILRKFQKGRSRPIEIKDEQNETTMSSSDLNKNEQKPTVATINLLDDDEYSMNSNCSMTSSSNQYKNHNMFF